MKRPTRTTYISAATVAMWIMLAGGCSKEKDTATLNLELLQAAAQPLTDVDDVQDLLEDGAQADAQNGAGDTALILASDRGEVGLVRLLIESGADVNLVNRRGISPLFRASAGGHADVAAALLENGANVNLATGSGSTPLDAATANGRPELASLLIKHRAQRPLKAEGKMIYQHSFEVDLPYFGAVVFAPYLDASQSGQLRFYLLRDRQVVYEFENYSGNIWPAEGVRAVAFRDVNGDGQLDILIISRHNNGAPAESLEPLEVAGVYLFGNNAYREDYSLAKELESQPKTILGILRYIQSKSADTPPSTPG